MSASNSDRLFSMVGLYPPPHAGGFCAGGYTSKKALASGGRIHLMRLKKTLLIALGWLSLGLGAAALAVPVLPSFPFLVMAALSFSRGSERLDKWFLGTKLYKDNLKSFLSGREMTAKAKIRVMLTLTVVMAAGAGFMQRIPWAQILLGIIWVGHGLLFLFGIRTLKEEKAGEEDDGNE
jgi:uncharacterized membrane protein YbaN (DUF454 family)